MMLPLLSMTKQLALIMPTKIMMMTFRGLEDLILSCFCCQIDPIQAFGINEAPFAVYNQPAHPDDVNNVNEYFQRFVSELGSFLKEGYLSLFLLQS